MRKLTVKQLEQQRARVRAWKKANQWLVKQQRKRRWARQKAKRERPGIEVEGF